MDGRFSERIPIWTSFPLPRDQSLRLYIPSYHIPGRECCEGEGVSVSHIEVVMALGDEESEKSNASSKGQGKDGYVEDETDGCFNYQHCVGTLW